MLVRLTQNDIDKIQIDEGIVVTNFGLENERILGPTRGGAEFTATPSIRDIEYDGRLGKTKGLQIKDGEDVNLKIATLCCSKENLALGIPGAIVNDKTSTEKAKVVPGEFGLIPNTSYLSNIAVVTKMLDNTFNVLKVDNPMHEGAFTYKAASKAENEHNLEMLGHYDPFDTTGKRLWCIDVYEENPIAE